MIKILAWDSDFFGVKIARATVSRLTNDTAHALVEQARTENVACVYLLADSDDPTTARAAENVGFHLMDVRVTHDLKLSPSQAPTQSHPLIRPFQPADLGALQRIARASFTDSRFYADPRFDREKCDAMYEIWITKSCEGQAQAVFVVDVDGHAVGFITCHKDGISGNMGLLGVDAAQQGKGLGLALVGESLRWFAENDCTYVDVVTQGRNIGAQRTYQRWGFRTRSVQLWYHLWLNEL